MNGIYVFKYHNFFGINIFEHIYGNKIFRTLNFSMLSFELLNFRLCLNSLQHDYHSEFLRISQNKPQDIYITRPFGT